VFIRPTPQAWTVLSAQRLKREQFYPPNASSVNSFIRPTPQAWSFLSAQRLKREQFYPPNASSVNSFIRPTPQARTVLSAQRHKREQFYPLNASSVNSFYPPKCTFNPSKWVVLRLGGSKTSKQIKNVWADKKLSGRTNTSALGG
jgi:hypothetical protein